MKIVLFCIHGQLEPPWSSSSPAATTCVLNSTFSTTAAVDDFQLLRFLLWVCGPHIHTSDILYVTQLRLHSRSPWDEAKAQRRLSVWRRRKRRKGKRSHRSQCLRCHNTDFAVFSLSQDAKKKINIKALQTTPVEQSITVWVTPLSVIPI